jgi:hypothetical protein
VSILTVATVAGAQRRRTQRQLAALAAQTIAAEIEVVVVDTRPRLDPIDPPRTLEVRVLQRDSLSFGEARAEAARAAGAEIVAYLEDHCYPEPAWAEALARAYREPWAAVGYAFGNANPKTRSSRMTHLAQYGEWEAPARGGAKGLPGNNVSYRRDVLLGLGSDLPAMLMADFNIHARLRREGLPLGVEPGARVRHENPERLLDGCRSSLAYSRVLAVERARLESWSAGRRLTRAVTILLGAPPLRLARLLQAARRRRRGLVRVAVHLPGILAEYLSSALGESLGYLFGPGRGVAGLMYWEVDAPRAAEP